MSQSVSCENFESEVHLQFDARMPLRKHPGLTVHASHCDPCSLIFEEYQALESCLQDFPALHNTPDTSDKHHRDKFGFKTNSRRILRRRKWIVGLSFAATLLLGLSLAFTSHLQAPVPTASNLLGKKSDTVAVQTPNFGQQGNSRSEFDVNEGVADAEFNWQQLSESLLPFSTYYQLSAELPGIRPLQSSLGLTIDWFQKLFQFDR